MGKKLGREKSGDELYVLQSGERRNFKILCGIFERKRLELIYAFISPDIRHISIQVGAILSLFSTTTRRKTFKIVLFFSMNISLILSNVRVF